LARRQHHWWSGFLTFLLSGVISGVIRVAFYGQSGPGMANAGNSGGTGRACAA
jgi:hypothetical protein